jgi:hypothetical protein
LFEDCKEFYDVWFDSSKMDIEGIASEVTIQVLEK